MSLLIAVGRGAALGIGAAGLALLAAGCGGGSKPPGVASLGPTAATTTTPAGGGKPSGTASFVRFVTCMNAHGVAAQVGTGGRGVYITAGAPGSSQFQTAQRTCSKFLPGGGPPPLTPAEIAANRKRLLALAQCMRAHGEPSFPDPNGQGQLDLAAAKIDPASPQFQAAAKTCAPSGNIGFSIRVKGG